MKHIIVGTAGHIDHGKTALVKALTGIDADRLEEEKRRGITIDLGFAHLDLTPALRLGFVDVPGHERFVKNMLAGVGGIDLVLFVIAADESIKPQTREHFDICRLLGIPRGVIALTKADLVDPDIVGPGAPGGGGAGGRLVSGRRADCAGQLRHRRGTGRAAQGTGAGGRPRPPEKNAGGLVPPAHRPRLFGEGIRHGGHGHADFRRRREGAGSGGLPARPGPRRLRVRGVQVHGSKTERAVAGQRTAVNLADIEPAELARGDVLSEPGRFRAVKAVDCRLQLLASAKPLKHRAPVHFHCGHGGDRGRGAPARRRGAPGAGRLGLRPPGAARRRPCCCPATASSSACFRRW